MKESQVDVKANTFVPWLDSALLPEESEYSVVNKAAWFLAMPPTVFLRACEIPKNQAKFVPYTLNIIKDKKSRERCSVNERLTPLIHGKPMIEYLASVFCLNRDELIRNWNVQGLRVCPKCIAMGVHLSIHQHHAIDKCPVHNELLQSTCPKCSKTLVGKLQGKQPAFCCEHCHASLLNQDRVVIYHTDEFRQSVKACVRQFKEWKMMTLLDQQMKCGIGLGVSGNNDISPWRRQEIQLLAGIQSVQKPSWVRHSYLDGVDIVFKTLDLNISWGLALKRGISGHIPDSIEDLQKYFSTEKATDDVLENTPHYICRERFRAALRRVTSIFLTRYGHAHPDCLNTPRQRFGNNITWNNYPEDILLCCPVAVGFWMWRSLSVDAYYDMLANMKSLEFTHAREANIDLLLYSLARSHLHYCIFLAKKCIDKAMESKSCRLDEAINPIEVGMLGEYWSPMYFNTPRIDSQHFDILGRAYYVHFDISSMLRNIPCEGRHSLDDRLLMRLESIWEYHPSKKRFISTKIPDRILEPLDAESANPEQPFMPTMNEYLFMPDTHETKVYAQKAESRWVYRRFGCNKYESKIDRHAVLNTSINSKHNLL